MTRATGAYERELSRKPLRRQKRQDSLHSLIVFNPGITVKDLVARTGWNERTIWNYLHGRKGYFLGLIDQEKVRTETPGPGRGKETRVFPLHGNDLTKLEMLRTKLARPEIARAEDLGCQRCGGDEDLKPISDETLCVWCRGAKNLDEAT